MCVVQGKPDYVVSMCLFPHVAKISCALLSEKAKNGEFYEPFRIWMHQNLKGYLCHSQAISVVTTVEPVKMRLRKSPQKHLNFIICLHQAHLTLDMFILYKIIQYLFPQLWKTRAPSQYKDRLSQVWGFPILSLTWEIPMLKIRRSRHRLIL